MTPLPANSDNMPDDSLESLKILLRALAFDRIDAPTLNFRYIDYLHGNTAGIPFRQYGYENLVDFFKSMPDVLRVNLKDGRVSNGSEMRLFDYEVKAVSYFEDQRKMLDRSADLAHGSSLDGANPVESQPNFLFKGIMTGPRNKENYLAKYFHTENELLELRRRRSYDDMDAQSRAPLKEYELRELMHWRLNTLSDKIKERPIKHDFASLVSYDRATFLRFAPRRCRLEIADKIASINRAIVGKHQEKTPYATVLNSRAEVQEMQARARENQLAERIINADKYFPRDAPPLEHCRMSAQVNIPTALWQRIYGVMRLFPDGLSICQLGTEYSRLHKQSLGSGKEFYQKCHVRNLQSLLTNLPDLEVIKMPAGLVGFKLRPPDAQYPRLSVAEKQLKCSNIKKGRKLNEDDEDDDEAYDFEAIDDDYQGSSCSLSIPQVAIVKRDTTDVSKQKLADDLFKALSECGEYGEKVTKLREIIENKNQSLAKELENVDLVTFMTQYKSLFDVSKSKNGIFFARALTPETRPAATSRPNSAASTTHSNLVHQTPERYSKKDQLSQEQPVSSATSFELNRLHLALKNAGDIKISFTLLPDVYKACTSSLVDNHAALLDQINQCPCKFVVNTRDSLISIRRLKRIGLPLQPSRSRLPDDCCIEPYVNRIILEPGEKLQIKLESVKNCQSFTATLPILWREYAKLEESLNAFYSIEHQSNAYIVPSHCLFSGLVCVALIKDKWCRVEVVDVFSNSECMVSCLDYGCCRESVPCSSLRLLKKEFVDCEIPSPTVVLSLYNIEPKDDDAGWDSNVRSIMQMFGDNWIVAIGVEVSRPETKFCGVRLYAKKVSSKDAFFDVADYFVAKNYARYKRGAATAKTLSLDSSSSTPPTPLDEILRLISSLNPGSPPGRPLVDYDSGDRLLDDFDSGSRPLVGSGPGTLSDKSNYQNCNESSNAVPQSLAQLKSVAASTCPAASSSTTYYTLPALAPSLNTSFDRVDFDRKCTGYLSDMNQNTATDSAVFTNVGQSIIAASTPVRDKDSILRRYLEDENSAIQKSAQPWKSLSTSSFNRNELGEGIQTQIDSDYTEIDGIIDTSLNAQYADTLSTANPSSHQFAPQPPHPSLGMPIFVPNSSMYAPTANSINQQTFATSFLPQPAVQHVVPNAHYAAPPNAFQMNAFPAPDSLPEQPSFVMGGQQQAPHSLAQPAVVVQVFNLICPAPTPLGYWPHAPQVELLPRQQQQHFTGHVDYPAPGLGRSFGHNNPYWGPR